MASFLNAAPGESVRLQVHPLVVLSVLDSYMRRSQGLTRVIGTLLGTKTANMVEVTSCFCVPHQESAEGEIAFDDEYNKRSLALKKAVSTGEEVVGWFATSAAGGADVDFATCYIHDHYGQMCGADTVHLVVDTSCNQNRVAVTGYVGSGLELGGEVLASQFHKIRVDITATSTEKIACDMMIKSAVKGGGVAAPLGAAGSNGGAGGSGGVAGDKLDDLDNLENSIIRLLEILDTNSAYVESVLAGRTPKDEAVGKEIFKALAAVPRMDPEVFGKIFNDRLQDMLMVVYLSNLTRTQLAICDKIAQCDALAGN